MGYAELAPTPPLRSLVACTWAFSAPGYVHRVLPDGCIDIVVLNERASVVGTMQRAIVVPASPRAVLGIRMRPGEAARLFPAVARELTDAEATLDRVWGADGHELEDALVALLDYATVHKLAAEDIVRRAQGCIEAVLRRRIATHGHAVDVPIRLATTLLASGTSVREVAGRLGISERQLERRFAARVGVGPKTFSRVRRLQRAAALLQAGTTPSEAAVLVGYADQAHFSREASVLTGVTPSTLSRELSDDFDTSIAVRL